jgi:hypothetical protein
MWFIDVTYRLYFVIRFREWKRTAGRRGGGALNAAHIHAACADVTLRHTEPPILFTRFDSPHLQPNRAVSFGSAVWPTCGLLWADPGSHLGDSIRGRSISRLFRFHPANHRPATHVTAVRLLLCHATVLHACRVRTAGTTPISLI